MLTNPLQLAAALTIAATCASGQNFVQAGGDTLQLDPHGTHAAQLHYSNSGNTSSKEGFYTLCLAGGGDAICVKAHVEVRADQYEERLTVQAPDGYTVIPADPLDVDDGEEATVLIVRPMF